MKSSKRSVKLAMRSRRSSKLHVMLGRLVVVKEGAWVDRRGGRIALLIESEDSNIVAIFFMMVMGYLALGILLFCKDFKKLISDGDEGGWLL